MQSRSLTRIFFQGSIGAKSDCPEGLGGVQLLICDLQRRIFETGRLSHCHNGDKPDIFYWVLIVFACSGDTFRAYIVAAKAQY